MLRFIKHNLSGIEGVEIYPIISLLIFFLVFITMIVFVIKLPKSKIDIVNGDYNFLDAILVHILVFLE